MPLGVQQIEGVSLWTFLTQFLLFRLEKINKKKVIECFDILSQEISQLYKDRNLLCPSMTSLGFPTVKINFKSMVNCRANIEMFWYHLSNKASFCSLFQQLHHFSSISHLSGYKYLLSGTWGLCELASRPVFDSDLVPFKAFSFIYSFLPSSTYPCMFGFTESVSCVHQETISHCNVF